MGPLGASFGPPGGLLAASWGLLGASRGLLGPPWGGMLEFSVRGPPLGPFLGPSWGSLGPSWAPLGPSRGPLGPSWGLLGGLLGRLGALLGASWAILEHLKAEKATRPKSVQYLRKTDDFSLSGPSCEASWRPLGASWRPLGPSWGHLRRLGALFGRLGGILARLGGLSGASWSVWKPSWVFLERSRGRKRAPGPGGQIGLPRGWPHLSLCPGGGRGGQHSDILYTHFIQIYNKK